jgi:hypothetical protein
MRNDLTNLEVLSTRAGFNTAVRHIQKTIGFADALGTNGNLGDLFFESRDEEFSGDRLALVLRMLLVDKLGYVTLSANLASTAADLASLAGEFAKWKAVDLIAAYHHPDLGLLVANPKRADELAGFGMLRKRELLVIYAGKAGTPGDELCRKAAETALLLFEGSKVKPGAELYKGNFAASRPTKAPPAAKPVKAPKAPAKAPAKAPPRAKAAPAAKRGSAPAAAPAPQESVRAAPPVIKAAAPEVSQGPVRMTPMYSVVVQNELFHNGNVEAWKRIIASYNASYPALQVYIYYEGERILDINSLFKWGKVKHGSAIQFAVAGNEIKDVAKLQRYLVQGASHQFEAFLRGPVSTVMKLF